MNLCLILIKTYTEDCIKVPAAGGFPHFGTAHLSWLAGIGTAALIITVLYEKVSGKSRQKMRKGLGFFCFFFHLLTQGTLWLRGIYSLYDLPLHLCALTAYLIPMHVSAGDNSKVSAAAGEILFFPCLPGLLSALVFPGWNESGALSLYSCSSFVSHGAMALYIGLCLKDGSIRPGVKRCWIPVLFLAAYAGLVLPFDLSLGPNFGFLKEPVPGTPLQLIADLMGEGTGYRAGFAILVLALEFLCYLIYGLFKWRNDGL